MNELTNSLQVSLRRIPTMATARWRLGRLEQANDKYRQAIHLSSEYAPLHNSLGNVLSSQTDFAGAIASYEKAIELDPTCANGIQRLRKRIEESG